MTGLVHPAVPDTSYLNMGNNQSMESRALAITYTGNLFSPHQVEAWFDRREAHDFIFASAYNTFRTDPSQQIYYNTKIPFTVANYAKSGANMQENDHLRLLFAGNFNRQIGIGTSLDYVYARGEYPNSSTKPLKWNSYGYYEGEQYKAYLSYNRTKLANQENGGITERGYILNPDEYNSNFTQPRTMETHLSDTWNDNDLNQIHFQHSYELGKWVEMVDPADSSLYDEFVPVATIFHNIDLESWKHVFRAESGFDPNGFFTNHYINDQVTNDSTSYRDFYTYAGIRLNEGFSRFSQFGIGAFVGYERQHYIVQNFVTDDSIANRNHFSNTLWVGGQLSRQLSSALTFDATARTALSGDKVGDIDIHGNLQTVIPFGKRDTLGIRSDSLIVQAKGSLVNRRVSYLMDHYLSNHFRWDNDFNREQHVRIEGKITYPRTHTSIRAGIEHISNYHYFSADDFRPHEYNKQMDIFGLEIRQGLKAGKWLNWDNALLVQTSTDDRVLALPNVSVESDLSVFFRIAKTLSIQAGCAAYWHTAYYAPTYQPATQQFAMQHDIECGNFPILNGYVNCNLKRIKFFIAMHNMLNGSVTSDTFLMPYYPIQPRRFEWGVILDLQN